jgi:hypothetical protein
MSAQIEELHPSLTKSNIKIGDYVIYTGEDYLSEVVG